MADLQSLKMINLLTCFVTLFPALSSIVGMNFDEEDEEQKLSLIWFNGVKRVVFE